MFGLNFAKDTKFGPDVNKTLTYRFLMDAKKVIALSNCRGKIIITNRCGLPRPVNISQKYRNGYNLQLLTKVGKCYPDDTTSLPHSHFHFNVIVLMRSQVYAK